MDFTITDTLDEQAWREFVDQHPQGNVFQTPEMFHVFSRAKGYRPILRAAIENNQVLALLLPVQVTLQNGPFRRLTTRSIVYGSTLCLPDMVGKEALVALLRNYTQLARRQSLFTELRHLSDQGAYQPVFTQCGFEYQEHLNYLINLNSPTEEIFNRIGARTRKHIRRELRKGNIVVEDAQHSSQIKILYELIKKSYLDAHIPLADFSLFKAAFDVLHPQNMVKFWLVRSGDKYIASSVELIYKDVVYGWYGGVDRTYSSYTPNELLMWHILKWGAENGYRMYDFGGAGIPGEQYGVRDFKSKFGGQLVCHGRNLYVHSPGLLRMSSLAYNILRRFVNY
jgi:lipid II:glycine glycyltransferase (peptidoglycan interpeptide bridge formation enzyme)